MQRPDTTYVGIVNLLQEFLDLFTFTAVEGVNVLGLESYRQALRRWIGCGFSPILASSLGTHLHKSQGPPHLRWALEKMVRSRRLELPRVLPHSDLNAARLPIPPRPHWAHGIANIWQLNKQPNM